eukprot:TRINITY_DN572_c2_g2_i1.p1 TRINITY_DN572_c2_g2~~TRINITY_DN572_c2_g2_i1.p1  ORF type:complete len:647 (+),score=131.56 TRINITY_DN572_c2_g2_i1:185-2125(+)
MNIQRRAALLSGVFRLLFCLCITSGSLLVEATADGIYLAELGFQLGGTSLGWSTVDNPDPCGFSHVVCTDGTVTSLDLTNVGVEGELDPTSLNGLTGLKTLTLRGNKLSGRLPIYNLVNLVNLDVSDNQFTGSIPSTLSKISTLKYLNLSSNNFTSRVPDAVASRFCINSFLDTPALKATPSSAFAPCAPAIFLASPPPPNPPPAHKSSNLLPILGGVLGGLALLLVLAFLVLLYFFLNRPPSEIAQLSEQDLKDIEEGLDLTNLVSIKRFTLEQMAQATDDWATEIGAGASSIVYKGVIPDPEGGADKMVAVKRLKEANRGNRKQEMAEFLSELNVMSLAAHRNVVRIEGFCIEAGERILIFPFMANGSVDDHLRGRRLHQKRPLSLTQRMQIAIGAARGLSYLHEECSAKIVHRDVKAANVLLSSKCQALLTDFGLAKISNADEPEKVQTKVRGTFGHIAPEYLTSGRLTEKADVYAFGVFLLELISGQQAAVLARRREGESLGKWVDTLRQEDRISELVDIELRACFLTANDEGEIILDDVFPLVDVANLCLSSDPQQRPTMSDCVRLLQGEGLSEATDKIHQEVPETVLNWNPAPHADNSSLSQSLMSFIAETEANDSNFGQSESNIGYSNVSQTPVQAEGR